jgi:excisionase family DNA binding protein
MKMDYEQMCLGLARDSIAVLRERRPFIAVGMAAAVLNVSRQQVYRLIAQGELEEVHFFGGRYVYVSGVRARLAGKR